MSNRPTELQLADYEKLFQLPEPSRGCLICANAGTTCDACLEYWAENRADLAHTAVPVLIAEIRRLWAIFTHRPPNHQADCICTCCALVSTLARAQSAEKRVAELTYAQEFGQLLWEVTNCSGVFEMFTRGMRGRIMEAARAHRSRMPGSCPRCSGMSWSEFEEDGPGSRVCRAQCLDCRGTGRRDA